ncbi:MAG: hypothetical protein QNJ81_13995 [Acidimicrobiia bacterium]|nr:hypothetical protein [Acidimicrobiia bacterium]
MKTVAREPTRTVPRVAATALAGAASGFLMAGPGARLAMRLSAQIDRSAHGVTTEAGAVVGEFTLGGTISFLLFVGLSGALIVALLWSLVSPWLPGNGARRKVAAFVVGAALGSRFAIDGRNFDFLILDPPLLQASIFVVLAGLTGVLAVVLETWLTRRLRGERAGARVAYWAMIGAGPIFAVPFSVLFFSEEACGCASPPWLVGGVVAALGLLWIARFVVGLRSRAEPQWFQAAGSILVATATAAGFIHLAGEVAHFV